MRASREIQQNLLLGSGMKDKSRTCTDVCQGANLECKFELLGGLNHINDVTKTFLLVKLTDVDAETMLTLNALGDTSYLDGILVVIGSNRKVLKLS